MTAITVAFERFPQAITILKQFFNAASKSKKTIHHN